MELHILRSGEESHQLPSIERAAIEVGQRLFCGEGVLEICKGGGLYDRFWNNFVNMGVRLPDPPRTPKGGRAMVFDFTRDSSSCIDEIRPPRELFRMEISCKLWKIGIDEEVKDLSGRSRIPMSDFSRLERERLNCDEHGPAHGGLC
jgi:hypothetical protein